MSRSSPGVMRVAAILDFMAEHPGQAFALTDLVRALKLSRATTHALLTSLVDVGYLYRASDKTYVLGPKLAAIGRAAASHAAPLDIARGEMRALSDEFDVVCSAFFLEGDVVSVRERTASVSHVGYSAPLGTRVKARPRSVAIYFAWDEGPQVTQWLAALSPPAQPDEVEAMQAAMAFARREGFLLMARGADQPRAYRPEVLGDSTAAHPIALLTGLEEGQAYPVASLLAPVFSAPGQVAFVLGLMGFDRTMDADGIRAVAARLRAACARVSGYLGG